MYLDPTRAEVTAAVTIGCVVTIAEYPKYMQDVPGTELHTSKRRGRSTA